MIARIVVAVLAALVLVACGEEAAQEPRRVDDSSKVQETEPAVREGVSDEQVEYMQEFSGAYAGDERFETCFAERVEGMEPSPRNEWPQLAGGMAAECAGTAREPGPIE